MRRVVTFLVAMSAVLVPTIVGAAPASAEGPAPGCSGVSWRTVERHPQTFETVTGAHGRTTCGQGVYVEVHTQIVESGWGHYPRDAYGTTSVYAFGGYARGAGDWIGVRSSHVAIAGGVRYQWPSGA